VGELHRVAAQLAAAGWQPRHLAEQLAAAEQEPYAIEVAQMRLVQEQLDLYANRAAAGDGLSRQV
jgi:hypothetical protein